MGTNYGSIIPGITNGLTFYIDAAKRTSYSGTGTSWLDLSGSGNNGILTNGPFHTGFGKTGSFSFDGVDDIVSINTYTFGNGNWSVSMWVKASSTSLNNYALLSNSSGGPVTNAFGIHTSKIFYRNYDGVWRDNYGNTTVVANMWYMLTWVNYVGASANLGTMQMFLNGSSDSGVFNSYTTNGGPCNAIGRNWFTHFNGEISNLRIYNRSISSSEVLQNYNATKVRFGL
jgi:hypothetical protein